MVHLPLEVLVTVVCVATAEKKLRVLDVLRGGDVVHAGGGAGGGHPQAGDGVEAALSEDCHLPCLTLLPHCEAETLLLDQPSLLTDIRRQSLPRQLADFSYKSPWSGLTCGERSSHNLHS